MLLGKLLSMVRLNMSMRSWGKNSSIVTSLKCLIFVKEKTDTSLDFKKRN